MKRFLLAIAALLASATASAQTLPPLRQIVVNGTPVATPWPVLEFSGGVSYSNDALNKRMVLTISGGGGGGGGSVTINTTSPLAGGATGSTFTLSCPTCVVTSGAYSNPTWLTALAASKLSGAVAVANGGTGLTSAGATANRALYTADGSAFVVGQLPNAALANSAVTVNTTGPIGGGGSLSLGGSLTLTCSSCLTSSDLGVSVQGYDADLGALAALATTGMVARTGAGTVAAHTITASAPISISNGDGVAGAPALSCPTCVTTARLVSTGTGLSGGGDLSADRTLSIDQTFSPTWSGAHVFTSASMRLPAATTPAQTADASIVWDSDDDLLTVGDGTARKTLVDLSAIQTLANKTLTTPTIGSFANANHNHTNSAGGGTLSNSALVNSAVTISTTTPLGGGGALSLGGTLTLTCSTCLTGSPSATGDLMYSTSGTQAMSRLAAVALGSVLASGGVGTAPQWLAPGGDVTGAIGALTVGKIQGKAVAAAVGTAGAGQDGYCFRWNNAGAQLELSSCPGAGGGATITFSAPSEMSVSGSPGDTISLSWASASGRKFIGSPSDGTLGAYAGRALVAADIPDLSATYQPLDSDLTAVAGLASTGLVARTGSGTASARTIAGGTGITVTNGDGVSGNPSVALTSASATVNGSTCTLGSTCEVQRFLNASRARVNNSADSFYTELTSGASANRTATLPDATGTLALLSLAQTWSAVQTHNNAGRLRINNSADTFYGELTSAATANRTLTLPDVTDTLAGIAATQTLTNKTISGASNTLSNIGNAALTNSATTVNGQTCTLGSTCTVTATATGTLTLGTGLTGTSYNGSAGVTAAVSYGTTSGTATQGNDTRLPPAPSSAGRVLYDSATAWTALAAGTSTQVLHGGTAPSWASVSLTADVSGSLPVGNGGTNITSYTTGDIIYAGGSTTLAKLADVAAGSFLRSGGVSTAPAWSTVTLPNTATAGDLHYASAGNTISNLAVGSAGRLLAVNDAGTLPAWGHPIVKSATINSGTTGAGNVDTTVLAIPAGATTNTNSFLVTGVLVSVKQAMVGSGSIALTCGATAGGTEFLASQSVTSSTGVGSLLGLTASQLGSSFTAANQYNALVNGSTNVVCRSAMTGTVSTQAIFQVTVMGVEL